MGGTDGIANGLRFALVLVLQVLVLRQINVVLGDATYLSVTITPVFLAALPLRTPRPLVVILGFLLGLGTDLFYESLGVHMAAGTLTGYARGFILTLVEPKEGFKTSSRSGGLSLPLQWWMAYTALMLGVYLLWYFGMEAFSPVFWRQILGKFALSLPVSWLVSMVLVTLLRPRL